MELTTHYEQKSNRTFFVKARDEIGNSGARTVHTMARVRIKMLYIFANLRINKTVSFVEKE